jgi:esterase
LVIAWAGKVAMQFALEHSDYVDRLIIADIAPVTYPPGHNEIFDALFKVNLRQLESRNEAEKNHCSRHTRFWY